MVAGMLYDIGRGLQVVARALLCVWGLNIETVLSGGS